MIDVGQVLSRLQLHANTELKLIRRSPLAGSLLLDSILKPTSQTACKLSVKLVSEFVCGDEEVTQMLVIF